MGKLLFLGLGTYLGIMAAVWMVGKAFDNGGACGIIFLAAWVLFWMWVASKICNKNK